MLVRLVIKFTEDLEEYIKGRRLQVFISNGVNQLYVSCFCLEKLSFCIPWCFFIDRLLVTM